MAGPRSEGLTAASSSAADPASGSVDEPLLNTHDIQGNILAGFNKDHQRLIALQIRDVAAARRWLIRILPYVSTLAEVYTFNALFSMRRARLGRDPRTLKVTWMNLAFSRDGIAKLSSEEEADALPDGSFRTGLNRERAESLGDPNLRVKSIPRRDGSSAAARARPTS